MKQLVYKQQQDQAHNDNLQNAARKADNSNQVYSTPINRGNEKLFGLENQVRSADRKGMSKRRDQEDVLKSVAQQYSNKIPSGSKVQLYEHNSEQREPDLSNDQQQFKKRVQEHNDRQQLISMAGNQIRRMEQQTSTSNQNIGQKSFKQQTQQRLLEDLRSSKLNKDNGLMSEDEFHKLNEKHRDSRGGGQQKRRTKLTLGRQGNKTQQVAEKYMKSNQSDNDRDIVSSYLNVPINPDNDGAQEKNPVKSRQKSNNRNRASNGGYKNNQNFPLTKKTTEVYVASNRLSQIQHQSQGENRSSLKQKLSENNQAKFPSTWKQQGNKLNLTQGDNTYSNANQRRNVDNDVEGIIQNATSALSVRTRSQSKLVVSSAKQHQNQIGQQQNMFQTANNTQRVGDDFGNMTSQEDKSREVDLSKITNRNQEQSSSQHIHLTMDNSIKNDHKSADQSREVLQQRNNPQDMHKYDLEATEKDDINDNSLNNNKFTGIFGFLNNVKKNLFQQDDEFNNEDGNMNEEKSGSLHSNDSPNAGQEVNSGVNINGANQYQLKLKRAGVGMSPQREKYYNRGAAYKDGRAPKNYGDSYMLTMSQHTIENRESQVLMNGNPFNANFDKLDYIENDNLRVRQQHSNNQQNKNQSPDLDNSVHTDNNTNTDLRRIQRKSQQETNGLNILQSTKMARSQHNYLGGQTNSSSQVLSAKNINQKPMFMVQSQSNRKENKRKMSQVLVQPNIDYNQNQGDQIEDPESSFRINYQEDDANWQEEIDHRQVKHAANLQMLKNQKRRSDLNLRLSQQIMNGSELSPSPYKGENLENYEQKSRARNNVSSQKKTNAASNEYTQSGKQVNLFGQTKNSGHNKSNEKFATPKKSSQQLRTETSPPLNQEDFDQLYNLQDGDSSDNNLQQNQNHKIVHQDGLQMKKTVDNQQNLDASKTPVQNSRISNYVPQSQHNSYLNIQTKSSCSFEQKQLMHRGEEPQAEYNHPEFSTQQQQQRRDNTTLTSKSNPAHIKGKIDAAFQNEVTQKYDQNLNKFLKYQPQLNQDGNAYTEINMTESNLMRNTAHFNGETDQDLQDYQNYNSCKPSDDKIVMKNRGHTTKNMHNPQQQDGSFLELYGKNHIKSHEINMGSVRHNHQDLMMGNNSRSPNGTDDNQWLFDGLQQSLNRTQRQTVQMKSSSGDNSTHVKSFHIDRTNNMVNSRHAQGLKNQSSLSNLPPTGQQQIVSSHRGAEHDQYKVGEDQSQNRSAKYTMKSKSPKNKVSSLQLLLRGKSQNRIESRGKHQNNKNQGEGLQDHGFFPQSKVRDKSNPPSSRYNKGAVQNSKTNDLHESSRSGLEFQDTLYDPNKNFQRQNTYQQRRGGQNQPNGKMDQGAMVQTMFSFFKNIFSQDNRDVSPHRNHRQSAETKASSGQSALQRTNKTFNGWSPQEALEIFGHQLTEFEKIELGNYLRIYTIGEVRRENQYSIADKDGFYNTRVGEQLGYRYMVRKVIDKGSFGQVVSCIDYGDPNQRIVAAKIGKNKKFDVDNANIEIKFLSQLNEVDKNECADIEGHDRIVKFKDSFNFRQHVIIIFEHLHMNLYKYISLHKKRKPIFDQALLKRISYQMIQGLKYMKNKQVIHCDMKPENIIFTDQKCQNIKIVDFGASCTDCASGFFYVQSRYYRAPEIVLGLPYDHAVDIWSLGCIIYELLTGRPIFPAKDENELLEFFTITIGNLPEEMITNGKNYKKFFKKQTSIFGSVSHELIRSKKTILGSKLKERSEPIRQLLSSFDVSEDIVDFIEKCLVYDVECRITPHDALFHQWFYVQKPIPSNGQQIEEQGH